MDNIFVDNGGINEPKAKYIKFCKILRKEAKKQHYSRLTVKSNNDIKTTWNIMEKETGRQCNRFPPYM
jgi:hypothetical protein